MSEIFDNEGTLHDVHMECGVAVVSGPPGTDVVGDAVRMGGNLTHRGQLAGGVGVPQNGDMMVHHIAGPFRDHIKEFIKETPISNVAGAHTRYATSDDASLDHLSIAQPMRVEVRGKVLALLFNGNIPDVSKQKDELLKAGIDVTSESDTEVFAKVVALRWSIHGDIVAAIRSLNDLEGAFSAAVMLPDGEVFAFRDRLGIRPLSIFEEKDTGKKAVVSESHAVIQVWGNGVPSSDIEPGEIVHLSPGKPIERERLWPRDLNQPSAHCFFEPVYMARRASVIEGTSVDLSRRQSGEILAALDLLDINFLTLEERGTAVVIVVPRTPIPVASGYIDYSGIPGMDLFTPRMSKDGMPTEIRTFIEQDDYRKKVLEKIKVNTHLSVNGLNVILIDDSIVRSNTIRVLIDLLLELGAKSVHVRIGSPPTRNPCYYGINMKTHDELFIPKLYTGPFTAEGVLPQPILDAGARDIKADSLKYLPTWGVERTLGKRRNQLCMACVDGQHPLPVGQAMCDHSLELFRRSRSEPQRILTADELQIRQWS